MVPYTDFEELLANRKNRLTNLYESEYLRFGDHIYVLRKRINITEILDELAGLETERKDRPVRHLHLYCHSLTGNLSGTNELTLKINRGFCALKTIYIFAAQLLSFSRMVLVLDDQRFQETPTHGRFELFLYYDIKSGPDSFWIETRGAESGTCNSKMEVIRGSDVSPLLTDTDEVMGKHTHSLLDDSGTCGFRVFEKQGLVVENLFSVPWNELRPLHPSEFQAFGEDVRRLKNLPRLLDGLFTSAGEDLMAQEPDVRRIIGDLRFIHRCSSQAPNLFGLRKETATLLSCLEPLEDFTIDEKCSCSFAPLNNPTALAGGMATVVKGMIEDAKLLENRKYMEGLGNLIRETSGAVIASAAKLAYDTDMAVSSKMTVLREYEHEMREAAAVFEKGISKYQKDMRKKFWAELAKGIVIVSGSIAFAVYTGGAGAPLTVGAYNKVLNGAQTVQEASPATLAFKALLTSAFKVYPKVQLAFQSYENLSTTGKQKGASRKASSNNVGKTSADTTATTLALNVGARIDYAELLANWREMDIAAESSFTAIKSAVAPDNIDGLESYRVAVKSLVVRGETLINALREANEAGTRYVLLQAEREANEAVLEEISSFHQKVSSGNVQQGEAATIMALGYRLDAELIQRRRNVFNLLYEGVLALMYQSDDGNLQKEAFSSLSPAMTVAQLEQIWTTFESAKIRYSQTGTRNITVHAAQVMPQNWHALLVAGLPTSFQIPLTLENLQSYHHMRLRSIYAEFVGLKRKNGSSDGINEFEYKISLGPLMYDRTVSQEDLTSTTTSLRYYMKPTTLSKQGKSGELVDRWNIFAPRTLCSLGKLSLNKKVTEDGWDLDSLEDIKLHIEFETLEIET